MRGRPDSSSQINLMLTHDGTPSAMVVKDKDRPENTAVMIRGQAETRSDVIPAAFLEVLSPGSKPTPFKAGAAVWTRRGHREQKQPTDRASHREPRVDASFRRGFVRTPTISAHNPGRQRIPNCSTTSRATSWSKAGH
jgi:hypothetical protein